VLYILLDVFFTVILIAGSIIGLAFFWQWFYSSNTNQDETLYFQTKDNWRLAAHRYRANNSSKAHPVILCHGMCSNRYPFDIPRGPSLAQYLSRRGWDVWVVELRGNGMSAKPRLFWSDVPFSWGFADLLESDLPAIIHFVKERTDAKKVHWVGHSMGGMLIQAHLAATNDSSIASAVTLGSASDPSRCYWTRLEGLLRFKWLVTWSDISFFPFIARAATPLAYWISKFTDWLFVASNMEPIVARRTVALASELVTPTRLWLELARLGSSSNNEKDGIRNYAEGLKQCTAPVLFIGGSRDFLMPHESICAVTEYPDNQGERVCKIIGKESGCEEDYGHVDLLVGKKVEEEVFPVIHEWLVTKERASVEEPSSLDIVDPDAGLDVKLA
jgi:pimeloyl-ACP methyl ester carboxylesterase